MNKTRRFVNLLALAAFTLALSAVAQAQATRTWVSGVGDDVNPCSRTAPCKTYAGAISKTAKDGEISTLDPGGFGAVTITKSITINGGGQGQGYGSILATATTGVIINITDVNDLRKTVRLNWLDINGATSSNPGLSGIRVLSAAVVHVENTTIDAFRSAAAGFGHGIHVNVATTTQLNVRNTTIRNCLNDGIRMETSSGQVLASITKSKFDSNTNGINAVNGVAAMIADCEISNNSTAGIDVGHTTIASLVNIEGCRIAFSSRGVELSTASSEIRLSNNFIVQNSTGINVIAGTARTSGNNRVIGNTTPVSGALQLVTQPI
jgi:hypothetical protein